MLRCQPFHTFSAAGQLLHQLTYCTHLLHTAHWLDCDVNFNKGTMPRAPTVPRHRAGGARSPPPPGEPLARCPCGHTSETRRSTQPRCHGRKAGSVMMDSSNFGTRRSSPENAWFDDCLTTSELGFIEGVIAEMEVRTVT